jgi:hypothetical protein
MAKGCSFTKPDGQPCQAVPLKTRPWCVWHDPEREEERTAAARAGGKKRGAQIRLEHGKLPFKVPEPGTLVMEKPGDVARVLSETFAGVRRGEIDPRIGSSLGYLGTAILKAMQQEAEANNGVSDLLRWLSDEQLAQLLGLLGIAQDRQKKAEAWVRDLKPEAVS